MRKFIVTIDGQNYEVGVEEVGAAESVAVSAPIAAPVSAAPVAAKPVVAAAPAPKKAAVAGGQKVASPFPGLIKNLLVAEGATVKKDQPILVLEAMKMDNDIVAPCAGVVSFNVSKGANVETDAVLAVIG